MNEIPNAGAIPKHNSPTLLSLNEGERNDADTAPRAPEVPAAPDAEAGPNRTFTRREYLVALHDLRIRRDALNLAIRGLASALETGAILDPKVQP
jgi:hypothetical protein